MNWHHVMHWWIVDHLIQVFEEEDEYELTHLVDVDHDMEVAVHEYDQQNQHRVEESQMMKMMLMMLLMMKMHSTIEIDSIELKVDVMMDSNLLNSADLMSVTKMMMLKLAMMYSTLMRWSFDSLVMHSILEWSKPDVSTLVESFDRLDIDVDLRYLVPDEMMNSNYPNSVGAVADDVAAELTQMIVDAAIGDIRYIDHMDHIVVDFEELALLSNCCCYCCRWWLIGEW